MAIPKGISKDTLKKVANSVAKGAETGSETMAKVVKQVPGKTKKVVTDSQQAVVNALDQDGNGVIDSTDLILMALKIPGVKIDRAEFLRKELYKNHSNEEIEIAIANTPAKAGIQKEEIDKIADEVIKFERNAVSGISAALGMPGGVAFVASIPADIAQYYGYMLRAAQKMLYLYGFPQLDTSDKSVVLERLTNSLVYL